MRPLRFPIRRIAEALALGAALALWPGCQEPTGVPRNPAPLLFTVNPVTKFVGTSALAVGLTGQGFVATSQVTLDGDDRVTTFVDESHLSVELLPGDVDSIADFSMRVVNPAPGGGTSPARTLAVRFTTPIITGIEPDTILTLSPTSEFIVTGTGFHPTTYLNVNPAVAGMTYVSPTEIRFTLAASNLVSAKFAYVNVGNPGAEWPNSTTLAIVNPQPQLEPIAPDSVFRGAGRLLLTVTGSGYRAESVVRIGGQPRVTQFVSSTTLRLTLIPIDARFLDTLDFDVVSPAPSLGTSEIRPVRVVPAPPTITGIDPSTIAAGTGDTLVSIRGTDFQADAVVYLDGLAMATTFVDSTHVSITIPAAALDAPATRELQVRNLARGNMTHGIGLPVLPPSPTLDAPLLVEVPTRHLVLDSSRSVLYATVPSAHGTYGNQVVRIDPLTGAVTGALLLTGGGDRLAITDDGTTLFVGLRESPAVARIQLSDFQRLTDVPLSGDVASVLRAGPVTTVPGHPDLVAVNIRNPTSSPSSAGTFLFAGDGQLARSWGISRVVASGSGTELYGFRDESPDGFHRVAVLSDGLHGVDVFGADVDATTELHIAGTLVFGSNGIVIDPASRTAIDALPVHGPLRADAAMGRVHVLAGTTLHTFALISRAPIGTALLPDATGAHTLVRWGADGLAVGTPSRIVVVRGSLVAP